MKPFYILLIVVSLGSQFSSAQTKLQPPEEFRFPENFEEEIGDLKLDDFDDENPEQSSSRELGTNKNGETEFSVLDNRNGIGADRSTPTSDSDQQPSNEFDVSPELNKVFTNIILEHLPHQYVQDKKWGSQSKRWAGVKFRRDQDDGKLETKRRFKMVNHGTWQKYSAELVDPNHQFSVELSKVSRSKNGATKFEVGFDADLKLDARQAKWVKGVQLYSVGAEGNATVRLSVSCEMDVALDLSQFPPDVVLSPEITKAKIDVKEFKLHRVGKAGGEFAQQISRLARKELDSKISEKEKKLVKKLNDKIDQNRGKLRLSVADAVRMKWIEQTREFLPEEIQKATTGKSAYQEEKKSLPERNAAVNADSQR